MATSGTYTNNPNRDAVIARALRIVGAFGQGETPDPTAVAEAVIALDAVIKELQADGMYLWTQQEYTLVPVAATSSYTVGIGSTINTVAPLKVIQAWQRNTTSSVDTPMSLLTRQEYNSLGNKTQAGAPQLLYYLPPGPIASTDMQGTVYLHQVPDATFVASSTVRFFGLRPAQDAGGASATFDFPSYYSNALTWALADELGYEYHVGEAERSMISKKAATHVSKAMSFDTEEGSLYLRPTPEYGR